MRAMSTTVWKTSSSNVAVWSHAMHSSSCCCATNRFTLSLLAVEDTVRVCVDSRFVEDRVCVDNRFEEDKVCVDSRFAEDRVCE